MRISVKWNRDSGNPEHGFRRSGTLVGAKRRLSRHRVSKSKRSVLFSPTDPIPTPHRRSPGAGVASARRRPPRGGRFLDHDDQALRRQYAAEEWVLGHLDRFLAARGVDLTAETFAAWSLTLEHLASVTRRGRMRVVRNVCLYRRRGEPGCFIPDERLFPRAHQAIRPHIFTDSEIVELLAAARTLARTSSSPLCPENMRLAIAVLSTTGLRRGELTRLTVGDYGPPQRMLAISSTSRASSRCRRTPPARSST